MKLLLIDPNIDGRAGEPPLNLALLKAYINERSDHKCKILDLTFHKKVWREYLSEELEREKYDLVGISCLSFNISQGLLLASFIKDNFNIKIIFGGIHIMLLPEEVISQKQVDMVCTCEGEHTLKELLDNDLNAEGVKGIWYKKNGELIKNERRELFQNLDDIPFPNWDDYDLKKYFRINGNQLSLMASRGCPYPCTYCSNHAQSKLMNGKWVRFRSIDNFMEEIELRIKQYSALGLETFKFNDDIFILRKDFVLEFCKRYKEKGYHKKILWTTTVRVNLVEEEIISAMRDAGCYETGMGIESVDDYVRNKVYKRNMSREQIDKALAILKKYNMQLHIPIIIGSPYDTLEIMERNLQFMKDLNPHCMLFPILMPLPKTEIREICEREGLIEEANFKTAHIMHTNPVIRTKYATREQIQKFVKKTRRFVIRKYFFDGLRMKGLVFLWDLLAFVFYFIPKYQLEIDNGWRFIINHYNLERIKKERGIR